MKLDRFINRPVLSTVISIIIVILGVIGLVTLPIEQYPDIAPPTVSVSASYTGANAQTTLNSVVVPLEEAINGVENMDYMSSSASNTGDARITITFRTGNRPGYGSRERTEQSVFSNRSSSRRSNKNRCYHRKTPEQYVDGIYPL